MVDVKDKIKDWISESERKIKEVDKLIKGRILPI